MDIFAFGLSLSMILIYLISVLNDRITNNNRELEEHEKELIESINQLESKQAKLIQSNNNLKQDKVTRLSTASNNVLNIYEKSNIRIQSDIIEELAYNVFSSPKEIFDYIENQRYYWRLENTKKPLERIK